MSAIITDDILCNALISVFVESKNSIAIFVCLTKGILIFSESRNDGFFFYAVIEK